MSTKILGADRCLQVALDAEKYIRSRQVESASGVAWRKTGADDSEVDRSLYHGSAGIVIFYLELFRALGEPQHLETAMRAGDDIIEFLATSDAVPVGFFGGLAGYAFVLNELATAAEPTRPSTKYREAARSLIAELHSRAAPLGAGVGWIQPTPKFLTGSRAPTQEHELLDIDCGAAGVGLTFLYAQAAGLAGDTPLPVRQIADRLIELAEPTDTGLRWPYMTPAPARFPSHFMNFTHGAAGFAYFLGRAYQATGERRYLDAALDGARNILAHTRPQTRGFLVCYTEDAVREEISSLLYLGYCHGAPGTGRAFYLLHQITGDPSWLRVIDENLDGVLSTGAPETRSGGFWNNYGQCCGDAGIADYALLLHRAVGDERRLDLANRLATHLLEKRDDASGAWLQAEHRMKPDQVEGQTGYMQGAAGIGSLFLQLATLDRTDVRIAWPDNPFAAASR